MGSDFDGIRLTSVWLKSYLRQIVFEPQVFLKGVLASFIHQGICSFFHLLIYIVAMVPVNILAFLLFSCTSILFMCPPPSNISAEPGWDGSSSHFRQWAIAMPTVREISPALWMLPLHLDLCVCLCVCACALVCFSVSACEREWEKEREGRCKILNLNQTNINICS